MPGTGRGPAVEKQRSTDRY